MENCKKILFQLNFFKNQESKGCPRKVGFLGSKDAGL